MILNALLLFQMLHFLLAYLILKYVLLKPALAAMKRLDREKLLLESNVALLSEEAARREAVVDAQWKRHCCVLYMRYEKGQEGATGEAVVCPLPAQQVELSNDERKAMQDRIAENIVQDLAR